MNDPILSLEVECVGVAFGLIPEKSTDRALLAAFEIVNSPIETATIELPIDPIGPEGVTVGNRYVVQLVPAPEEPE